MEKVQVTTTLSPPAPTPRPGKTIAQAMPPSCATATFPPKAVRSWMRNRRMLAGAGLAIAGSGLALGWDWLTAVGVAPLIVSAAPCLVMCALGLCMIGRGHQVSSGSSDLAPGDPTNLTDRSSPR